MVLVASSIQTARIRHGDKASLCRRMSNALTDESKTRLSLPLCIFLLIFTLLLSSLSTFIPYLIHSFSPSHSYLYLSEAVSPSFLSPLLLFPAVKCSFTLHFSLSLYFLSHFTHLLSLSVCLYLSKFKFALLPCMLLQHGKGTLYKVYTVSIIIKMYGR